MEPNQTFVYTIKARWAVSGQTAIQERRVNIQAGQAVTVDFRANIENAPPVLPRFPIITIPRE